MQVGQHFAPWLTAMPVAAECQSKRRVLMPPATPPTRAESRAIFIFVDAMLDAFVKQEDGRVSAYMRAQKASRAGAATLGFLRVLGMPMARQRHTRTCKVIPPHHARQIYRGQQELMTQERNIERRWRYRFISF